MTAPAPARPLTGLLRHLDGERRAIVATTVLVVVSQVCLGAISVLLAAAVGRAVVLRDAPPGWFWALLAGLVILRALLTWGEMDASHALAFRVLARLRMALFDRYAVALPTRRRENVGRAASTAMADTERLEFFYAHTAAATSWALNNQDEEHENKGKDESCEAAESGASEREDATEEVMVSFWFFFLLQKNLEYTELL